MKRLICIFLFALFYLCLTVPFVRLMFYPYSFSDEMSTFYTWQYIMFFLVSMSCNAILFLCSINSSNRLLVILQRISLSILLGFIFFGLLYSIAEFFNESGTPGSIFYLASFTLLLVVFVSIIISTYLIRDLNSFLEICIMICSIDLSISILLHLNALNSNYFNRGAMTFKSVGMGFVVLFILIGKFTLKYFNKKSN